MCWNKGSMAGVVRSMEAITNGQFIHNIQRKIFTQQERHNIKAKEKGGRDERRKGAKEENQFKLV